MVYSTKKIFLIITLILSCGLAFVLAWPHENLTTQLDEIGMDVILIWGLPLIPLFILQASNNLTHKKYPDVIYISLFSLFWLFSACSVIIDELF